MKLLHWETGGFVLYYKRLEQGTFRLPFFEGGAYKISWWELTMMVSGIMATGIRQNKRYNPSAFVEK